MFTGIVEEIGRVENIFKIGKHAKLYVKASMIPPELSEGESIAVNGVCLTVVEYNRSSFAADISSETLSRSNLGEMKAGDPLNLERALRVNDRFGGHIVSGHIDGVGVIRDKQGGSGGVTLTIQSPDEVMKYVIIKGSITVDGISLTVADRDSGSFKVSVIPYTARKTSIGLKGIGARVNLEADIIGKYIERFMYNNRGQEKRKEIDRGFLMEHGFI
ncbi:MAG: riboflavin synthase [Nitrospinota bacterium]